MSFLDNKKAARLGSPGSKFVYLFYMWKIVNIKIAYRGG